MVTFVPLAGNASKFDNGECLYSRSSDGQTFAVDPAVLPVGGGQMSAQPRQARTFQSWYMDSDLTGMPRSNFTNALAL